MPKKVKVIFDANIWISFTIGKRLSILKEVILNKIIDCYICPEIISEYIDVVNRPKIQKYVTKARVKDTLEIIEHAAKNVGRKSTVKISRDIDDDYLLAVSHDYDIDYLVTGDKDLLVLKRFGKTKIIKIADFLKLLGNDLKT